MSVRIASHLNPSTARDLLWWNESALEALAARLAPAWRQWCLDWEFDAAAVSCVNVPAAEPVLQPQRWTVAGLTTQGQSALWLGVSDALPLDWLSHCLFGQTSTGHHHAPQTPSVADTVASQALGDLALVMAQALDLVPADSRGVDAIARPVIPEAARPWSGVVDVSLKLSSGPASELKLRVGSESGLRPQRSVHAPGQSSQRPALASILDALASRPVILSVDLQPVALDLGLLQSLCVGDVLTLSHPLQEPVAVHAHPVDDRVSRLRVCDAFLGRQGERRAIELAHVSTTHS